MPTLPEATTTIDDTAGAQAGGADILTVIAAVPTAADITPRVFSSIDALLTKHGYAQGVDYVATHVDETDKPVIFVGLPIVTAGAIGSVDGTGNTGTSVVSVAAGSDGVLEETDGSLTIVNGGTVGTDQITADLSLDGGVTTKRIRIGVATSYTIPYVGQVLSLKAGTLVASDVVLTWNTTAPRWDQAGLQAARTALAAQQTPSRSWLIVGDLLTGGDADDVCTEVNGYETSNDRFVVARAQARDRHRAAKMSRKRVRMTGSPQITFAEVGATGDTITRATGSFITDGFAVGDVITVSGAVASAGVNNVTGPIASLSATVITLGTTDLVNEGPISDVVIVASNGLTFAEVGATGDTITRTAGSFVADGFKVGDEITVSGSVSNNFSDATVTNVTATVLTLDTQDLVAEVIGSYGVSITADEEEDVDWVTSISTVIDNDGEKRFDIGAGRATKLSTITGHKFRRPVAWAASVREYQHDVQIPTWRKADGKLSGWSLEDEEGNTIEHDERIDGGLLLGRFTCFRSWANGPRGTFIAMSLTRATEGSLLSFTHNMAVINVAQTIMQAEAENAIGQVLELKPGGKATEDSLVILEERVNTQLDIGLLQAKKEGKRASSARWTASRADILNVVDAELNATGEVLLDGTLVKINTRIRVPTAG